MAVAQLSPELQLVAWAALIDLKKRIRKQKTIAEELGISPYNVSNALRKKWASREVLDAILKYLDTSEVELVERYGSVLTEPIAPAARSSGDEPSALTIAVARTVWDSRLEADQRESIVRSVVALVQDWGSVEPTVQVWLDLLRSHALLMLFGDNSGAASKRSG